MTGATGKQGGAVASRLLWRGHEVHALTRRPESPAARMLRSRGARIVVGDFGDPDSYSKAMEEVDAVFAMSTPLEIGVVEETRRGEMLVDTARRARVRHLVFASVSASDLNTGIAHFESKFEIEQHMLRADVPWTIVAPVFFMENLLTAPQLAALRSGRFTLPLPTHRPLQLIALDDIGAFVAQVIENRDAHLGRRIEIASDELSGAQMAAILSAATRRPVSYSMTPLDKVRERSPDLARMFEWLDDFGFAVDVEKLRFDHPQIAWHRFIQWVRACDWDHLLG